MASSSPRAGGLPIAFGTLVGAGAGAFAGYPVHGAVAGLVLGGLLALAIWLIDRRG